MKPQQAKPCGLSTCDQFGICMLLRPAHSCVSIYVTSLSHSCDHDKYLLYSCDYQHAYHLYMVQPWLPAHAVLTVEPYIHVSDAVHTVLTCAMQAVVVGCLPMFAAATWSAQKHQRSPLLSCMQLTMSN